MNNMVPFYVRTGYEAIIPIRSPDKFCTTAIDDGKVISVTDKELVVEYKTKGKISYKIKSWTSKEEAHACFVHYMKTDLKAGTNFEKDDTLIYDPAFYEPDIFNPKRVIYKQGNMLTVALLEDPETYEDSVAISRHVNGVMATVATKVKSTKVDATDTIENFIKIGTPVEPDTTLFSIVNAAVSSFNLTQDAINLLSDLKSISPKADIKGKIHKIEIKYNCKFEELSPSLKKIVAETDKRSVDETGYTGDVSSGGYSIEGVPLLPNEVEIKVYINVDVGMGIGDKMVIGNQLKCTVGEVFNYDLTSEEGEVIDATFSSRSIYARIVVSPMLLGTTGMVMEKLQQKVVDMYFK